MANFESFIIACLEWLYFCSGFPTLRLNLGSFYSFFSFLAI